jgi:hypothetical protein
MVSTSLFPRAEIQLPEAPVEEPGRRVSVLVAVRVVLFSFVSRSKLLFKSGKDLTGVMVFSVDGGLDGEETIMDRM